MVNDHVYFMGDAVRNLPNAVLVSAAEPAEELRQKAVERWGVATTYATYEEMFAKETLDGVLICSDNADKVKIVTLAAAKKVHCYVDKPMSGFLWEADEMVRVSRAAGIKMMIAYHPYFNTTYNTTKGYIQGGKIGQVYLAKASIGHAGPREINLTKWFCEWLENKKRSGGGAFGDEAGYVLSTFIDFLGPITEISSFMTQQGWRDYLDADMEDNSVAILKFASGALGMIDSKWGQIGRMPFAQSYHGTDGTILTGFEGLKIYSRVGVPKGEEKWEEVAIPREPRGLYEARRFVDTVLAGGDFEGVIGPEGSLAVQEAIEAAYMSAEQGHTVKLPIVRPFRFK
jgi:predicted dehydrogenase